MKNVLLPLLMAGSVLSGQAALLEYRAILNGLSEAPSNSSLGTGYATAVYDTVAHT